MSYLSQSLQQRLNLKLSPQQIQGIKLLELPSMLLEARIKQEIEDNPVLEEEIKTHDDATDDRSTIEDYLKAEEASFSYKLRSTNSSADDEQRSPIVSQGKSLNDFLTEQLSYFELSDKEFQIAAFIIGTLDSDGYLRRESLSLSDDLAFTQGIDASPTEIENVVSIIQQLEPSGIAARTLSECLLIQLRQLREQTSVSRIATRILKEYFDEFLKKHYDKMRLKMGISQEQQREALNLIMSLNPKPANGYSEDRVESAPLIIPDFTLEYNAMEDTFDLQLLTRGVPDLKINSSYARMAQQALNSQQSQADKEALQFIKQKIESARWFITAIKQRHQTLSKTMRAIVDFQHDYFKEGDSAFLRPMILKDIAERTGFDISTISRVVNSKYIQTHFGTFLLKYFFSEGLNTENGDEVSTLEIKRILRECIDNEDPRHPMTDEALMIKLHDKGYMIARRTVAKYREMLDIPVARLRKEL